MVNFLENELVVKSNSLIEAKYELNLMEQKIILYAVSKLDTNKESLNKVQIEVKRVAELIDSTVKRYTEFRMIANKLMDRRVYLADKPNLDVRWLASSEYIGNGKIELEFSEKLTPYLLQLKSRFTRYELKNILYLKNKHSIRVYELLKQYQSIKSRSFTVNELKEILMLEEDQYSRLYDFERFILKLTMDEINELTDINVSYEKIKKGRKVVGIKYTIESKEDSSYITFLNESYNIKEFKLKSGLENEHFDSKQIIELFTIATEVLTDAEQEDLFEYIRINYLHMLKNKKVENKYAYLKKALKEDHAVARGQMKFDYSVDA